MRIKLLGQSIIFTILILLLSSNSLAIGISPARYSVEFEQGLNENFGFTVIGTDRALDIGISATGELSEYVTFSTNELSLGAGEEAFVQGEINLPYDLVLPEGENEVLIVAREIAPDTSSMIDISLSVATKLIINVPYPGKYASVGIELLESGEPNVAAFLASIRNAGEEDITSAKGVIEIYNVAGVKEGEVEVDFESVKIGEEKETNVIWKEGILPGAYTAKIIINYDGNEAVGEEDFDVGADFVEFKEVYANNFDLGEIAKTEMVVENKWYSAFDDVKYEIIIREGEQTLRRFSSATESLRGFSEKTLIGYWDTSNVEVGLYDAILVVYYGGGSDLYDTTAEVGEDYVIFGGTGAAAYSAGGVSLEHIIGIILLLGLILYIIYLVFFSKSCKKKKGKWCGFLKRGRRRKKK